MRHELNHLQGALSRRLRTLIVAVALAAPLALQPFHATEAKTLDPPGTSTGKRFAQRSPEVAIRRFAEIGPGLTRGGDPGEEGLQYLKDHGYKTIVSFLSDPAESAWVVGSGMRYVHIPIHSGLFGSDVPTQDQVQSFLSVVRDSSLYPMFIHCHAGKDRTGAMSAIYRMEACGWTADEAVQEMNSFGFSGRYRNLMRFVRNYPVLKPGTAGNTLEATGTTPATAPVPAGTP